MKRIEISDWDTADYLNSLEEVAAYLDAVLADGDDQELQMALGNIARSKGMTKLAKQTGITRDGLYKALAPAGNPSYTTVRKVVNALGLRLAVSL